MKSLICINFAGGNDSLGMVIPTDASNYALYSGARGSLAIASGQLVRLSGTNYGLHPLFSGLSGVWNSGQLAIMANVGTLLEPTTKAQITGGTANLPSKLFSHSDQSNLWQLSQALNGSLGWAGSLCAETLSFAINMAGNRAITIGAPINYTMGTDGPLQLYGAWSGMTSLLQQIRELTYTGQFEQIVSGRQRAAMIIHQLMKWKIDSATAPSMNFPASSLGGQMEMVITTLNAFRNDAIRLFFYVEQAHYDTHIDQANRQTSLFTDLKQCLEELIRVLKAAGLWNDTIVFTTSEFGRTLTVNDSGTDHGWGGHQIAFGSGISGGIFGTMPSLVLSGNDDYGQGRMIPTTSTEQYHATLGTWFGASLSTLSGIFPRLQYFTPQNIGFVRS